MWASKMGSSAACAAASGANAGKRQVISNRIIQFPGIASGSLAELETELELGIMLNYLPDTTGVMRHVHRVGKLLTSLRTSLRDKENKN